MIFPETFKISCQHEPVIHQSPNTLVCVSCKTYIYIYIYNNNSNSPETSFNHQNEEINTNILIPRPCSNFAICPNNVLLSKRIQFRIKFSMYLSCLFTLFWYGTVLPSCPDLHNLDTSMKKASNSVKVPWIAVCLMIMHLWQKHLGSEAVLLLLHFFQLAHDFDLSQYWWHSLDWACV